jgi:hypothetical protein
MILEKGDNVTFQVIIGVDYSGRILSIGEKTYGVWSSGDESPNDINNFGVYHCPKDKVTKL